MIPAVPVPVVVLTLRFLIVSFLLLLHAATSFGMVVCHCEGNLEEILPDARSAETADPSLRAAARQAFDCTPGLGKFIECEGVCILYAVSIDGIKGSKIAKGCAPASEEENPPPPAPTAPVNRREENGSKSESESTSEPDVNFTRTSISMISNSNNFQPGNNEDVLSLLWDYASQQTQNQNAREVPEFLLEMYMCNKEKCNHKIGQRTQNGPGQRPDECQNGAIGRCRFSAPWATLTLILMFYSTS